MIKLNIINMKNFLAAVNACTGAVYLINAAGEKENINKMDRKQKEIIKQYHDNRDYMTLTLDILKPSDYMSIISYYAGDC